MTRPRLTQLIATLILLGAGSALAQDAPPAPPPAPDEAAMPHRPMGGPGRWMHGRHERMAMMTKAAAFRFKRDGGEIDIKCAADEPTKACVDAAGTLIDKVFSTRPH